MKSKKFNKVLIVNRGEIALRIIKAVHALGKSALVFHSFSDRELPFVQEADETYSLGSGTLAETYLDQDKIIRIARKAGADAIHPGYGFLAENADFAEACKQENITFIGPEPELIRVLGDKSRAREKALELGLPLLKGFTGTPTELAARADQFPYPVLIKPSAGGGGKGMRIVRHAEQFEQAALEASREAENYFGSGALYVEQFLENPRHIEVQIMADLQGRAVHLFERECSIQRRYQKIIEEAPSASISPLSRKDICESALRLVKGMGYTNAGTVEFLMDDSGSFFFLEMNTRIQVEHPVTEMITGIDLVKEQITIAEGAPLSFKQEDLQIKGHAIECRIYAEDPALGFLPSTGTIGKFIPPEGHNIRLDSGYREGNRVESLYDPMIAKLIAHGSSREDATKLLIDSLKKLHLSGLTTNRDYLISILQAPFFAQNSFHTMTVEQEAESILEDYRESRDKIKAEILLAMASIISLQLEENSEAIISSPWENMGHWRLVPEIILLQEGEKYRIRYEVLGNRKHMKLRLEKRELEIKLEQREGNDYRIRIDQQMYQVRASSNLSEIHLDVEGHMYTIRRLDIPDDRYMSRPREEGGQMSDRILAPLNGRIIKINHKEGDQVEKNQPLLLIESMKMENKILAPQRSIIKKSHVSVGDQVQNMQLLFTLESNDRSSNQ
ncbi:MAG: biotin carboxylase N-terminal domain-containing protein [Bacteroides sp.]|nr:biotin carboxylase N-terminal domain-containing protein [Bacteroides sp.]